MEREERSEQFASTAVKPLRGKRILVTRAREQAAALISCIEAAGGEAYLFPVIQFSPPAFWDAVDAALACIHQYQWLVITSPNGARFFMNRLQATGRNAGALSGLKVAAVGSGTAQTLERLGVKVDVVPRVFRGAALPQAMEPYLESGQRVLMARGDLADPAHAQGLRDLGAVVDDVVVYRTLPAGLDRAEELKAALAAKQVDYVTFTSGSTVRNLLAVLGGKEALAGVRVAVIGQETYKAAVKEGLTVDVVASVASMQGMVDAIIADAAANPA